MTFLFIAKYIASTCTEFRSHRSTTWLQLFCQHNNQRSFQANGNLEKRQKPAKDRKHFSNRVFSQRSKPRSDDALLAALVARHLPPAAAPGATFPSASPAASAPPQGSPAACPAPAAPAGSSPHRGLRPPGGADAAPRLGSPPFPRAFRGTRRPRSASARLRRPAPRPGTCLRRSAPAVAPSRGAGNPLGRRRRRWRRPLRSLPLLSLPGAAPTAAEGALCRPGPSPGPARCASGCRSPRPAVAEPGSRPPSRAPSPGAGPPSEPAWCRPLPLRGAMGADTCKGSEVPAVNKGARCCATLCQFGRLCKLLRVY